MPNRRIELSHVLPTDQPIRWGPRLGYVIVDTVLFVTGLFLCLEAVLLRMEHVSTFQHTLYIVTAYTVFIMVSRVVYIRLFRAPLYFGLGLDLMVVFLLTICPAWLVRQELTTIPMGWLPLWWHQLPGRLELFLDVSPLAAIWLVIAFLAMASQVARSRPMFPLLITGVFFIIVLWQYLLLFRGCLEAHEIAALLVLFLVPLQAAVRGRPRLFARSFAVCLAGCFIFWHTTGILPPEKEEVFSSNPGVELIYPTENGPAPILPSMITDIEPCRDGRMIYFTGGRTGELFSRDLGSGAIVKKKIIDSNLLQIESDQWTHHLFVLDSAGGRLLEIEPGTMRSLAGGSILTDWGVVPHRVMPMDKQVYVTYSEMPGVAEFSARGFREYGGIQFRKTGMTTFRTGAWDLAAVREIDRLIVLAGVQGTGGSSVILGIDPIRFKASSFTVLPDSGPAMAVAPENRKAYVTSFFRRKIYEVDLVEMRLSRTLPGPRVCRAIVYDPSRRLLYAAGRFDGVLEVIDTASGKRINSEYACRKIETLELDEKRDRLWLSCVKGIYSIELSEYIGAAGKE